ncbi:hypothetical protein F5Y05DRAFT_424149 [Hypoxylon sp. FL0543]|nr:hypothetical protein F5Y05DRAFT_424149 [Hypoxylon sp. FL0543]
MLTSAELDTRPVFHPMGDTPAVSLTQDVPPEETKVCILVFAHSDMRNILFTSHVDTRNILLLSLILDDGEGSHDRSIWSIYYHLYLDSESLELLRSQAKKLHELSATMEDWHQSKYAGKLRFCDSVTLAEVRKTWELYSTNHEGDEFSALRDHFASILQQGSQEPTIDVGAHLRPAFPVTEGALDSFLNLSKHYWKFGTLELDEKTRETAQHPNPMFLTSYDGAAISLSSNPVHGFHLSPAYVPLHPSSPLYQEDGYIEEKVVALARTEFREWEKSYREHLARVVIHFYVGNAIPFAHSLRHRSVGPEGTDANWYRDQYHLEPLALDEPGYPRSVSPPEFDVIDTSSLCDVLGPLTLLTAISPLLKPETFPVIYTEAINRRHSSHRKALEDMLCGDVPTLSMLLGLLPMEYWTNSSPISYTDEASPSRVVEGTSKSSSDEEDCTLQHHSSQTYLKIRWKRPLYEDGRSTVPLGYSPPVGLWIMQFDPKQLAEILYLVYCYIFRDESPEEGVRSITPNPDHPSFSARYNVASFVSFLRLIKGRVDCKWGTTMYNLIDLIDENAYGENKPNMGEFYVYLQIFDVFTADFLKLQKRSDVKDAPTDTKWGDSRDWASTPPVCVTLKIPREDLSALGDKGPEDLNRAQIRCSIGSNEYYSADEFSYIARVCQLGFGEISTYGDRGSDDFEIKIKNDSEGWDGESPLIVVFYVPTSVLLLEPLAAVVACTLYSPAGVETVVYEATLRDTDNVYISPYAPGLRGFPMHAGFMARDIRGPYVYPDTLISIIANIGEETGRVTSLTARFNNTGGEDRLNFSKNGDQFIPSEDKSTLSHNCEAQMSDPLPCKVSVSFGETFNLSFPFFVGDVKARINSESSYVEMTVQVGSSYEWTNYLHSMYPVIRDSNDSVNWNMPYIDLENQTLGATSPREVALQNNKDLPRAPGEETRVGFKKTIHSIFSLFATTAFRAFRFVDASNDDIHFLVLTSSLRIDLSNRAAVLDCAIVPLYTEIMPKVSKFFPEGISDQRISIAELQLWKHVLPAYVERCRTWPHQGLRCEYYRTRAVPLTAEDDKPFLCACGYGKFPPNFCDVDGWDGLSKYAVRAAISPPFYAPFDVDR